MLTTVITAFGVLLPVLFVVALGFWAGRAKRFDSDQVAGLNELVLNYAFPALLFVAIVRASRDALFSEAPFVLALIVAALGLFVVVALLSVFVLRHSLGSAAIQSISVTYSNASFAGIPILTPLFGQSALLTIATAALIFNITLVPVAVTMLEYDKQRAAGAATLSVSTLLGRSVVDSFKRSYVWAPLLATILVLLDVRVPTEIQSMLDLIGSATAGVALFVAGLILAAYRIKVTTEILGNVLTKMVVQPGIMALMVLALAIAKPVGSEAILICAISPGVICPMLAVRYKVYEAEAASTFLLATLLMIVVVPIAIVLTH